MFHFTKNQLEDKKYYLTNEYKKLRKDKKRIIRGIKRYNNSYYYEGKKIIPVDDIQKTLKEIYNDPLTGYKGINTFYDYVKDKYIGIKRSDIIDFLKSTSSHTMNRQFRKRISKPIISKRPYERLQMDITELKKLSRSNKGIKYFFIIIDHYSKYVWLYPMKKKSETYNNIKQFIDNHKNKNISIIQSDNGLEFKDNKLKKLFKENKINHIFSSTYKPQTNGLVERFNRTIKSKIYQHLTHTNGKKYIDILQDLVDNYNDTKHSTTKYKPKDLIKNERKKATEAIQENAKDMIKNNPPREKIKKGDIVKININTFDNVRKNKLKNKGYVPQYTATNYKVIQNNFGWKKLKNLSNDEVINKRYFDNDLIKVYNPPTKIRSRRRRKKTP